MCIRDRCYKVGRYKSSSPYRDKSPAVLSAPLGYPPQYTGLFFAHGYLAVDFFFALSGFVIGYAYDDRWKNMTIWQFFKRRLIRLHPLVILGAAFGLIAFLIQGSVQWDGTQIPTWRTALAFLMAILLIPAALAAIGSTVGELLSMLVPLSGVEMFRIFAQ